MRYGERVFVPSLGHLPVTASNACLVRFIATSLVCLMLVAYVWKQQGLPLWFFSTCFAFLVWIRFPSEMGVLLSIISQGRSL